MPIVMGILNVTPDSFSDGGAYAKTDEAVAAALAMVDQGAAIIDVGGESTRPGCTEVSADEELSRVIDVVSALAAKGVCVSIDTRHAAVAAAAVEAGAAVINDVTGFSDPAMVQVALSCDAGLVVVHTRGDIGADADGFEYTDVVAEVAAFLKERAESLEQAGVDHARICVDPGPGFGKSARQTLELVRNFHEFVRLGYPVIAALSRKSYIGYAYGIENPADRDRVSAAEALMACELGASVVRAHNVEMTVQAVADLRPLVVIGMGCNVALVANEGEETEGKIAMLQQAISGLCSVPDSQIIDISSFYESEPAYYEDQDTFINAVMFMRTGVPPKELLEYLHAIENSLGRVREIENGPRTCDLDIVDYQLYVIDNDILTLPHPRALERDFVVKPLMELNPGFVFADGTPVSADGVTVGHATKL